MRVFGSGGAWHAPHLLEMHGRDGAIRRRRSSRRAALPPRRRRATARARATPERRLASMSFARPLPARRAPRRPALRRRSLARAPGRSRPIRPRRPVEFAERGARLRGGSRPPPAGRCAPRCPRPSPTTTRSPARHESRLRARSARRHVFGPRRAPSSSRAPGVGVRGSSRASSAWTRAGTRSRRRGTSPSRIRRRPDSRSGTRRPPRA